MPGLQGSNGTANRDLSAGMQRGVRVPGFKRVFINLEPARRRATRLCCRIGLYGGEIHQPKMRLSRHSS